jgi:hypothetical protein
MGTWGPQNFENDAAKDFTEDFQDLPGEALLLSALATAIEEEEVIESEVAQEALAAAEMVAAALGRPVAGFPEGLQPLVSQLDLGEEPELQEMAQDAVAAIIEKSELKDAWEESPDSGRWQAAQQDLLARLQ